MKKNLIIFYPSFERGGVTKILINLLKSENNKKYNFHIISSDCPLKKRYEEEFFSFIKSVKKIIHTLFHTGFKRLSEQ